MIEKVIWMKDENRSRIYFDRIHIFSGSTVLSSYIRLFIDNKNCIGQFSKSVKTLKL